MNEYEKFIESKKRNLLASGFDVEVSELNKNLFDFQQYVVKTAIKKGKYAIFADCGVEIAASAVDLRNAGKDGGFDK